MEDSSKGGELVRYKPYEKIREMREDNHYSQQQIADLIHIGQRTYSDYESGKTRIPLDSVITLACFYNVDLNYLTGVSQIKRPFPTE